MDTRKLNPSAAARKAANEIMAVGCLSEVEMAVIIDKHQSAEIQRLRDIASGLTEVMDRYGQIIRIIAQTDLEALEKKESVPCPVNHSPARMGR